MYPPVARRGLRRLVVHWLMKSSLVQLACILVIAVSTSSSMLAVDATLISRVSSMGGTHAMRHRGASVVCSGVLAMEMCACIT